jgi:hypothetical protein
MKKPKPIVMVDAPHILCLYTDRDAVLQLIEDVASQMSLTASNKLFFLLDYSLSTSPPSLEPRGLTLYHVLLAIDYACT